MRADHHDYGTIEGRLEIIQEAMAAQCNFKFATRCCGKGALQLSRELAAGVIDRFRKRIEVSGSFTIARTNAGQHRG